LLGFRHQHIYNRIFSYPDTLQKLQDLEASFLLKEPHLETIQEGVFRSEAKDTYQYNVREYNTRVKVTVWQSSSSPLLHAQVKSKAPASLRKMSCDILPPSIGRRKSVSFGDRKRTVSFCERKRSESEMSDTDAETGDFNEKSEEKEKKSNARIKWKIGIGKVRISIID
jgi:hypothetical protein